jgi:hypothetical protein
VTIRAGRDEVLMRMANTGAITGREERNLVPEYFHA